MTSTLRSIGWTLLAVTAVAPLAAQRQGPPPGSSGLWLGGGAGLGWARVACRICDANRGHSLSAYGHVGFALSSRLLLGGEVELWRQNARPDQNPPGNEWRMGISTVRVRSPYTAHQH